MFNSESIISLIKFNSATFLRKLFSNINSVKESLLFSSHNNFENKFFNSSLFIWFKLLLISREYNFRISLFFEKRWSNFFLENKSKKHSPKNKQRVFSLFFIFSNSFDSFSIFIVIFSFCSSLSSLISLFSLSMLSILSISFF